MKYLNELLYLYPTRFKSKNILICGYENITPISENKSNNIDDFLFASIILKLIAIANNIENVAICKWPPLSMQ